MIGFALKGPPKWGIGMILEVGAKVFGGKVHRTCAFSDIFGPDLTWGAVALCVDIAICHRRKFGQVWGSPAPLPEVAGKIRCRKAPLWTFDSLTHSLLRLTS